MKDFGTWLHDLGKSPEEKMLPEGIWLNQNGDTVAECCRCKKSFVVDYVDQLPQEETDHYCGGSPRCCP